MNERLIRSIFPNASRSLLEANGEVSHAQPEHNKAPTLGRAGPREKESVARITVRFIGYRVRPLDPDNFAGSVKDLLDGLRHCKLLPGDEPWRIKLETEQEKVARYSEERTEIVITYP